MRPYIDSNTLAAAAVQVKIPRGAQLKLVTLQTDGANAGSIRIGNTNPIVLSNPGALPQPFSLGAEELKCFEGPLTITFTGQNADYCVVYHLD